LSLESVELLMAIERHFQVSIPDQDSELMMTAGDIHRYLCTAVTKLEPSLEGPSARQWSEEELWDSVRALLAEHFGISPEKITPTTHLIQDLGL
jgi:acyl carrier protein